MTLPETANLFLDCTSSWYENSLGFAELFKIKLRKIKAEKHYLKEKRCGKQFLELLVVPEMSMMQREKGG